MCLETSFRNLKFLFFSSSFIVDVEFYFKLSRIDTFFSSAISLTNQLAQIQKYTYSSVRNTVIIYKKYFKELNIKLIY